MPEREKAENLGNEKLFDEYWNEADSTVNDKPNSEEIYQKLRTELFPPTEPKIVRLSLLNRWVATAVAVILVVTGIFWFNQTQTKSVATAKGENKIVTLPDGSKIELFENSQIQYAKTLGNGLRKIELKGDAIFTVIHNAEKPFEVFAGEVVVKDIGTIFKVNMFDKSSDSLQVSVMEGSVSVQKKNSTQKETVLHAGEQLIYHSGNKIVKRKIEPRIKAKSVEFSNSSIRDVFKKLSSVYGVEFDFDDSITKNKTYTGKFEDESIDEVLNMMAFTLKFKHHNKDGKILISFDKNDR